MNWLIMLLAVAAIMIALAKYAKSRANKYARLAEISRKRVEGLLALAYGGLSDQRSLDLIREMEIDIDESRRLTPRDKDHLAHLEELRKGLSNRRQQIELGE